jgi:hypothetical protein
VEGDAVDRQDIVLHVETVSEKLPTNPARS